MHQAYRLSLHLERWSDGTLHEVCRDRHGRFTKLTTYIEVPEWTTKPWIISSSEQYRYKRLRLRKNSRASWLRSID
jgi:hypothetical protein